MTTPITLEIHMPNRSCSLKLVFVTLFVAFTAVPSVLACTAPNQLGKEINSPAQSNRKLKLVEQTVIDNVRQSTLRQKFLITNTDGLMEEEVRNTLLRLFESAKNTCRTNPLQGTMIFLFLSADTVDGTNWVGRLDTERMTPKVDVITQLLPRSVKAATAATSRCETPGAGNTGKKSLSFDDDITLPPVKDRKIIGTWNYENHCTLSFEEVRGITYEVLRCTDCSGGKTGQKIARKPGGVFQRQNRHGEYFRILPNGNLGSFDRNEVVDTYIKSNGLWP